MVRALIFLALFCQCARAAYVAIALETGALVELDAAAYFSFASHEEDYAPLYMPAQGTCQRIIDAQLVQTDATYRIDDWYYMPAGNTGISTRVSIVDLELFVDHAHQIGVWDDVPDCDTIWDRIVANVLADVYASITWPVGSPLFSTNYGVQCALYCDNSVCTAAQLSAVLQVAPSRPPVRLL